jgi:hypothetical protein
LNGELSHILVAMLHKLCAKFLKENVDIWENLIVVVLHENAHSVKKVLEIDFIEIGGASLGC